ncbi:META domain-containing protein [Propionibacteriaceae bacterium Y1923]|uniref:META domain-containing protein n=1 Tax=Aestuariimicrobium sp. Y1814 TaxID=3418742 RepID=UPI003C1E01CA
MDNDVLLTTHVWGSPEPRPPHLRFGTDGRVTGSDGCNRLMGRWAFDEDDIDIVTLSQMASTMMFCEGVDDWLKRADQVRLHPERSWSPMPRATTSAS